ncbi:hypothetical protein OU798_11635 [Prolixibacteraceae bacterium Z1-6]|uniref:Uncharacterized protein n=1 Tax=Draconibacterium aestuarii TaxID=2998507 RepID=A0A9X3F728_9BACT|nr:hypothetical protein [Prolixibacteraceae bacterium Z1-6]
MKKLNNVLVVVALMLFSGIAMATGNLKVFIIPGENDEAVVRISNAIASQYEIEIRNMNNDIVYYKQTSTPVKVVSKTFDFSALRDGEYSLEVWLDKEKTLSLLNVKHGKVTLVNQEKEVQPYFVFENERLDISYLNHEKDNVMLYVYDNKTQKLIHEEKLGSEFAIHRAVDFSKLGKGSYNAILSSHNHLHEYNVTLKQ